MKRFGREIFMKIWVFLKMWKFVFNTKKFSKYSEQLKDKWSLRDHYAFLIILTELKIRSIISKRNINVNVLCNIFLQKKAFFQDFSEKRDGSFFLFISQLREIMIYTKIFSDYFFPSLSLSTSGPAFYRDEEFKFEIREVRKVNLAG